MPLLLIIGGISLLVGLFALVSLLSGPAVPATDADKSLQRWVEDPNEFFQTPGAPPTRQEIRRSFRENFGSRLSQTPRGVRLAEELARSDLKIRPAEWVLMQFGLAIVVGLLIFLRLSNPIGLVIGIPLGYFAPGLYMRTRQNRRRTKFEQQLGETVVGLSNALKSGQSFPQAFGYVSHEAPEPIGSELGRVLKEMQLGVPVDEALIHMVRRNNSDDLELMSQAIQIHRQVGGNLTEVLDNISKIIRERVRIKGEVRILTSQARASAWVISLLPIALALMLSIIAPDYFTPIFHSVIGLVVLGLGAFSMLVGIGIIRKIVQVKV